ncbi:hydroxymethylglutaryl-CoA lyase [Spelaeicoccus albus]|uniref:Hydroxymethylglutaryl-CoA lyase n=1 Tax=Spelaeicoccus albus TaxID=1280376 RepID=A0A7Z0D040_9MICO|nr:hydroxymethylglutaryl-CoA lyase [Spelaeicoccus albus]NYI66971.1 hydroxymethylglutaryl-CoA lyase [Spelaeicoccus albus]
MADVDINECFARDGLQHESTFIDTDTKLALLDGFARTGFARIEATSYSNPRQVPAFSDAGALLRQLTRHPGVYFKATCPNVKGVERALADYDAGYGAEEISLLTSASNSHSLKNLRATRDEQWQKTRTMAELAQGKFRIVGVVSVAFGCPFEGKIDQRIVLDDVRRFREFGADIVTIGDTTGLADPASAKSLFVNLSAEHGDFPIVAHFHDTRGAGLANALAAYEAGCRRFDTAMGGVGGHPAQIEYGSGETGNIATEDAVNLFESMGVDTGLDLDELMSMSAACERALARRLTSKVSRAGLTVDSLKGSAAA